MFKRRSTLRSPNRAKKRRLILIVRCVALCIVLAFIVFGLSYLSKVSALTIRDVVVIGNSVVPTTEIERLALEHLRGNYLKLFPRNNIFLYPKRAIGDTILADFSRVKNVVVSFKNFHAISIVVEEYKPTALWCAEKKTKAVIVFTDDCYFMDETGYVFIQSPQFSGSVLSRYYGSITSSDPVGLRYLPEENFRTLHAFVGKVSSLGLSSQRVLAQEGNVFTMYLENGGMILFSSSIGLEKTLENLQSILSSSSLSKKTGSPLSGLDYLDLRFGNKIFYKFIREDATSTPL